ncbi:MAG: polysaccharide deacetylase family protein [Firmicutes bacterium]|nr:polysaccharide deacetylase family protein [Bacillota bacterium]
MTLIIVFITTLQPAAFAETMITDQSTDVAVTQENIQPQDPILLDAPLLKTMNVVNTGKPKLTWNEVSGADSYAVYRALRIDGEYKQMVVTSETSWVHKGAIAGSRYYYKVQALSADKPETNSLLSPAKARVCDLKRPVCKVELNQKGKPKLTWKAVKNAEKYEIYRALKEKGTYKKIATVKNTTYTHKKAYYHETYYYKVKAIDAELDQAASAKSMPCSVYTINLTKKLVALTFDDGPGPYTKKIVSCLKKNDSRATFYVLGQRVKSYPSTLRAMQAAGNEIGNHSYSHPLLSSMSGKQIRSQVNRTDNAVKKITGVKPATIRPPYGGIDSLVTKNVGKPMILWSIDTLDWQHRNAKTTVNHVMRYVSDGDIVLMHDIHEPTMIAALELIPKLKKKGYELVTVSELAKYRGVKMKNGKRYYNF